MLKALIRKEMMDVRNAYFNRRRKKTAETQKGGKGRLILFIFLYLCIAGSFFALSALMGSDLMEPDLTWIYFMIMNAMAFLAGVLGSVFSTSVSLFQAKDNEFLLSLPIPPHRILIARMVSVYIMGLIYESMVLFPALLFYFFNGNPSFLSIILCLLGFFVLGFVVLVFSCFFGWIVALISSKLKNKAFLTVIISVIFIGLFIWMRISANSLFRDLAMHGQEIGMKVKGWGYPLYALGLGMTGNILAFLLFTAGTAVLFFLTCFILSRSFLRIASPKGESSKATFSEKQIETRGLGAALRRKEMKRFTASPMYMINCGLGTLFLLAGTVFLFIKMADIRLIMSSLSVTNTLLVSMFPVFGVFAVCLLCSFCDIAAPSISLEAKNLWLYQSMPIAPYRIFWAKLYVHIVVTSVPALLCTIALIIVLQPNAFTAIFMILCVAAFILFSASAMLALDLRRPMLDWTNEAQPIKQSINILISMFGSMLLALGLGALFLLVGMVTGSGVYLLICTLLFVFFAFLIHRWLRGKGSVIFATL